MPRSRMLVDERMMPMLKDLLPKGVKQYGAPVFGPYGIVEVGVQGKSVPRSASVKMSVDLDLRGNAPVRTVTFEPVTHG